MNNRASSSKEIEIRGKFSSEKSLHAFLKKMQDQYALDSKYQRLSVIFTDLNTKGTDIQVRLLNKKAELVVKTGSHTSEVRNETTVEFNYNDFTKVIEILNVTGITDGVIAAAQDWVFTVDDMEIKVTLCDEIIYAWEIEAKNQLAKIEDLYSLADKLGLKPMKGTELKEYWSWMKKHANHKFEKNYLHKQLKNHLVKTP